MAKFNGYGGGFGGGNNMQQLMRQAQQMQKQLAEAQKELAESEVVATSAGGMVEVVMGCDRTLTSIKIKPEAVDPDDVEMLEDKDIDAVLVCSSTDTHADIAIAAAKAGKHVFCEKPVDLTPEKAKIPTIKMEMMARGQM